jgi:hypothetical protein
MRKNCKSGQFSQKAGAWANKKAGDIIAGFSGHHIV